MYNLTHQIKSESDPDKLITVTEPIYTIDDFPFDDVCREILDRRKTSSRHSHYLGDFATFDIETTTYISGYKDVTRSEKLDINAPDNPKHHKTKTYHEVVPEYNAFMYIWQFCIADRVIMGRDWISFGQLLTELEHRLELTTFGNHLVIYVHNLPYEFQFIRNFFKVSDVFAIDKRKVVKCTLNDVFELRCSYKLSNMSLEKFLENTKGVQHFKKAGKLDYSKLRTPTTPLTDEELSYCYDDVKGLREAIISKLVTEHDTLATIPLTSTGYVRREFRAASKENPKNYFIFKQLQLKPRTYRLCKEAVRGGNCHANPHLSNKVWDNVYSYDMSSAYPAIMCQCKFPMTPFLKRRATPEKLYELLSDNKHALLMKVKFTNLEIKTTRTVAYISKSKCKELRHPRSDNGRLLESETCTMSITDIDFRIIQHQYTWEGEPEVLELYSSIYDYLPIELRNMIVDQYRSKCELKFGDPYLYAKYKNRINADFGMMLTDICRPEILYNPYDDKDPFKKQKHADDSAINASLVKYYKSQNSFLTYQWGLWVTAHCRNRLQKAIDAVGIDMLYCDTDSCKFLTDFDNYSSIFDKLNADILAEAAECGVETSCDVLNPDTNSLEHFQLGVWEKEQPYEQFKTMGAKKYAYNQYNKKKKKVEFGITVAGLSKVSGADYLREHGGMDAFNESTDVPPEFSGRTTAFYKDVTTPYYISIKGERIYTASAIALVPTSYTFSLESEYQQLLADLEAPIE